LERPLNKGSASASALVDSSATNIITSAIEASSGGK